MVCILVTWTAGLAMGSGHVVYASWEKDPNAIRGRFATVRRYLKRWHFVCQAGVGGLAFPAAVQRYWVDQDNEPLIADFMAPPDRPDESDIPAGKKDRLAHWNETLHDYFELGTLYTMIAGLLNILVIYDAYAGPVITVPEEEDKPPPKDDEGSDKS